MAEHKTQAETQVAIGNSITGLRLISELDWSDIFESGQQDRADIEGRSERSISPDGFRVEGLLPP